MPLLQGQPFKLVKTPDLYPDDAELFTIQHTGEIFLNKSDYEDRLALYSQSIWTCQCTGRSGLSHNEAWMSEVKARLASEATIPSALQKSILNLVHHSLSPLEQLIEASLILCNSQFHLGEILILYPKDVEVKVVKSKDLSVSTSHGTSNGLTDWDISVSNGSANGSLSFSGKENCKDVHVQKEEEEENLKKEMLPKLYDVLNLKDKELIADVSNKHLRRSYKVPSKEQLRVFIRSCAIRQRGSTCTPWVVSEDLVKKFSISNKIPNLFMQSKSPPILPKRKFPSDGGNPVKKVKCDFDQSPLSVAPGMNKSAPLLQDSYFTSQPSKLHSKQGHFGANNSLQSTFAKSVSRPLNFTRPPGRPPGSKNVSPKSVLKVPKKRGRPALTTEEKERNKKMREASFKGLASKMDSLEGKLNVFKVKVHTDSSPAVLHNSILHSVHPLISSAYKSPVKRATTAEEIMKLPFMRRFVHEHRTIKGVLGQFRRYAHTMDIVLAKLSPAQVDLIPEESMRQDLKTRQKKVQDKKLYEKLTPEERKQHQKDKARSVALERWKERKMKNLKVEDHIVPGVRPIPNPTLVETTENIPNNLFGELVMVTDFIKCFQELLLGEEKFCISTRHLMEAISLGNEGYRVIADIMCCILPTIVHDHISKNSKEIGIKISVIPINYQTAPELARLCLMKQEDSESASSNSDENYEIGKEESELSDELLSKLEWCEFWQLSASEIIKVLVALVHRSLCTASVNNYLDEVDEKVLQSLRERRKVLKQFQKAASDKRKEERIKKKLSKGIIPKKQRGRPKGYSPKLGRNISEVLLPKNGPKPNSSLSSVLSSRRLSIENSRREKEDMLKAEKEKQKILCEDLKKKSLEKKYEDMVFKRDNIIRRTPIGLDRDHNRYWIFHATTPGLYVEKGWVDASYDYSCSSHEPHIKKEVENSVSSANGTEYPDAKKSALEHSIKTETDDPFNPSSIVQSKMSLSPMKLAGRGRPPKEAYVLVDEDKQTFPIVEEHKWCHYKNLEEVKSLMSSLNDKGLRESQLLACLNLNKDRLQYHYHKKLEPLKIDEDSSNRVKESLREDIIQIERELIEGWLGGVPDFDEWERRASKATDVETLGNFLIEVQRNMQMKNLKGIMAPVKEVNVTDFSEQNASQETAFSSADKESSGVVRWRVAVKSCRTYSRLHVLVGLFDSCIRWEKSMATRKCKVCRNKKKDDPLVMCEKCETNYHYFCLRPPLKEDPGESWCCPACMPRKTRREEVSTIDNDPEYFDEEEKGDPTFSLSGPRKRKGKKRTKQIDASEKRDRQCLVCCGRIGLIVCAKCSNAFHSECHNPPLLSRARKDWICGDCLNPQRSRGRKRNNDGFSPVPNYFSGINDEVLPSRRGNRSGVRDRFGRFLRNLRSDSGSATESDPAEVDGQESNGRLSRGTKTKALDSIRGTAHSRRSSRTQRSRKIYEEKNESESEAEGDSDTEQLEDDDIDKSTDEVEEVNDNSEEDVDVDNEESDQDQDSDSDRSDDNNEDDNGDDENSDDSEDAPNDEAAGDDQVDSDEDY